MSPRMVRDALIYTSTASLAHVADYVSNCRIGPTSYALLRAHTTFWSLGVTYTRARTIRSLVFGLSRVHAR